MNHQYGPSYEEIRYLEGHVEPNIYPPDDRPLSEIGLLLYMGEKRAWISSKGVHIYGNDGTAETSLDLLIQWNQPSVGCAISIKPAFKKQGSHWIHFDDSVNGENGTSFPVSYHHAIQKLQEEYVENKETVRNLILAIAAYCLYQHEPLTEKRWMTACYHYDLDTKGGV